MLQSSTTHAEKQAAIDIEPTLEEEEEEEEEGEKDKDAGPTTTENKKGGFTSLGENTSSSGDGTTPKRLTEDGGMVGTKSGNDIDVEPDLAYIQVVL